MIDCVWRDSPTGDILCLFYTALSERMTSVDLCFY